MGEKIGKKQMLQRTFILYFAKHFWYINVK